MATIHVLKADTRGSYRLIVHVNTPGGNNSAGKSWEAVLLAANITGDKAKRLPHATDPNDSIYSASGLVTGADGHSWQITAAELAQLAAGTKIEIAVTIKSTVGMDLTALTQLATKEYQAWMDIKIIELEYFGLVHTP